LYNDSSNRRIRNAANTQFCNHRRERASVLRHSTQTCAITTAAGKYFMLLEYIIFSYSVKMIYEESGDFWDLLEA